MKVVYIVILTIIAFICGYLVKGKDSLTIIEMPLPIETSVKSVPPETISPQNNSIQYWNANDEVTLEIVTKHLTSDCEKDFVINSCEELSILDKNGKRLFHFRDVVFESIQFINLTRNGTQLLIESNGGGTDNFLLILDYRNGKVVEIIDSTETQMRGGYWMMNEYKAGNKTPAFKASQIFIVNQIGGADDNPSASVFRYKDDMYKKIGEIKMKKLGDFIDKELSLRKLD